MGLIRRRPPEPRVWDNLPPEPAPEPAPPEAEGRGEGPLSRGYSLQVWPAGSSTLPCNVIIDRERRLMVRGGNLDLSHRVQRILDEEYAMGAAALEGGFRAFARDPSTGEMKRDTGGRPVFSHRVDIRDPPEEVLGAIRVLLELRGFQARVLP